MGLLPPNYRHLNRTVKYRSFYQPITDSLIAWPGGVREGRAAFATVSALPSHKVFLIAKSLAVCKEVPCIFRKVQ